MTTGLSLEITWGTNSKRSSSDRRNSRLSGLHAFACLISGSRITCKWRGSGTHLQYHQTVGKEVWIEHPSGSEHRNLQLGQAGTVSVRPGDILPVRSQAGRRSHELPARTAAGLACLRCDHSRCPSSQWATNPMLCRSDRHHMHLSDLGQAR